MCCIPYTEAGRTLAPLLLAAPMDDVYNGGIDVGGRERKPSCVPVLSRKVKSPFGVPLSPQTYYKRRHDAFSQRKDAPLAVRVWVFGAGDGDGGRVGADGG